MSVLLSWMLGVCFGYVLHILVAVSVCDAYKRHFFRLGGKELK